eukprot:gnl/TRDRNA2_/TRDRNA2_148660_c0_seq1.p1 gnl/TRDRNA2_/TRDRNA2_148660_c0~~gnl/TRDRNA2_/TRDRNA2_148660_c0_seq1.p1  ORF type:complete len:515 (-),score=65.08 gnl/TRDRNA2_/TRDRNA2_148660_c0_seq1:93-1505(-)
MEVLLSGGHLRADTAQSACIARLQVVWEAAQSFVAAQAAQSAWKGELRQNIRHSRSQLNESALQRRQQLQGLLACRPAPPVLTSQGVYLWGGVGRGKSLLMDIFATSFDGTNPAGINVSRQHYHEFMHALHQRLHALRQSGAAREAVATAAAEVRQGRATVLCLDEFQVTSIADAVILRSLFAGLLANGVMIVTTSNRPPEDLYKNGLNHMLYMPSFIHLLKTSVGVHHIDTPEDYRVQKAQADNSHSSQTEPDFRIVSPETLSSDSTPTDGSQCGATLLVAWGRKILCNHVRDGNACFTFNELCGSPFSAEDYMALIEANRLHTLSVSGVPRFSPELHNEARRFTNLVDCLYERQCRLLCTAAAPPEELMADMASMRCLPSSPQVLTDCTAGMTDVRISELDLADARLPTSDAYSGVDPTNVDSVMGVMSAASASLEESGFAARRCVSRLQEMGTAEYRAAHHIKWILE